MSILWKLCVLSLLLGVSFAGAERQCKVCNSSNNDKCIGSADTIDNTKSDTATECFTLVESSGIVQRGFVDDTNKCDTKNCEKCSTDGCNNKNNPFACKVCDSSKDANCATWADSSKIDDVLCPDGINKCVMKIKEDKHIERGCVAKNDDTCSDAKTCNICATVSCNKDVFPNDRPRCFQCESSSECANLSQKVSLPCVLYDAADKCFTHGTSSTDMARGCVSNTTEYSKCTAVKEKCIECQSSNCNNRGYTYKQSLTCIQCDSTDAKCAWGYDSTTAQVCQKEIEYYKPEGCYTNKLEGDKAVRGCLNEAPDTLNCDTADSCKSCNTANGCNNADAMDYSCYKCRSDENPKCALELDGDSFKSQKCRNPVTAETKGCYVERWNDIIMRSCLVDADVTTRKQCQDPNYKDCVTCADANCNKNAPPGSASSAALGSCVLALSLLMLKLF